MLVARLLEADRAGMAVPLDPAQIEQTGYSTTRLVLELLGKEETGRIMNHLLGLEAVSLGADGKRIIEAKPPVPQWQVALHEAFMPSE